MKNLYLLACFTLIICFTSTSSQLNAQYSGGGEAFPGLTSPKESMAAFQDKRFGMFIHWGPVTLRGEEISWSRGREIPINEYDKLYESFNPVLFSAEQWVTASRTAGMKYIVITTRHHDGFSLWDSKFTDYDMASTPYGKGILKELSEECQRQGIAFGTYYSICDWYRPDYPVVYPYQDSEAARAEKPMDEAMQEQMDGYITFMKNQLEELIVDYNSFLIWFDGEWEWAWTHEMGMDMYAYLRGLKPDILINNRVDKGRNGMEDRERSPVFAGDYATPEQQIGTFDNKFAWETCMTIGNQWAWKPEEELKSTKECIQTLARTIGGDGNLLFNVGPMPDGRIEQRQLDRLQEMGDWVSRNQEAIYGTRGGPFLPTAQMVSTHKGNRIYLYLLEDAGKSLELSLEKSVKVKEAFFLDGSISLQMKRTKDHLTISLPETLPDAPATVIVLELDTPASDILPR